MEEKTKKPASRKTASSVADKEMAKRLAKAALRPSVNAAAVMCEYARPLGEIDVNDLVDALLASLDDLKTGNMERCEGC